MVRTDAPSGVSTRRAALLAALALCLVAGPLVAADPPSAKAAESPPGRARIVDRNGVVLAVTEELPSIFANPARVDDVRNTARELQRLIPGTDATALERRLADRTRAFVWVAHRVDETVVSALAARPLPGIAVRSEASRRYPLGAITAHVVGFTDGDARHGAAGVERHFDRSLDEGHVLELSIDAAVQTAVHDQLVDAVRASHAKGGAAAILDTASDELLALVSLPDFDPNDRASIMAGGFRNHLTSEVHEMGGIFEIFSIADALERGRVVLDTPIDVARPLRVGRTLLRDDVPAGRPLSVADVFARSSVVGVARIAQTLAPEESRAFLDRVGLLDPLRIELPERAGTPGIRRGPWGELTRTSVAYGYGIAVTPLQALAGATALLRGGRPIRPTLVHAQPPDAADRPAAVDARTSRTVRTLLRRAVTDGTGHAADVAGLSVGGKTGTSFKVVAGVYDKTRKTTWFLGGFPMDGPPRFTFLVMLDEPSAGAHTAAMTSAEWNAAPLAGSIIARVARMLPGRTND